MSSSASFEGETTFDSSYRCWDLFSFTFELALISLNAEALSILIMSTSKADIFNGV